MPPASLRLVTLWACLAQLPLVLGGLAQDLPGPAREPALADVFACVVVLAAGLPFVWAALGAGGDDARAPWREAALLAAAAAPALSLAWPYAAVEPGAAAAALAYVAGWWACAAAIGAWGPRVGRPVAVAVAGALVGALPLWIVVWTDLLGAPPPVLTWLSPTWVAGRLLAGDALAPAAGCLALATGLALVAPRLARTRSQRVAGAVALGVTLAALGPAHGDTPRARPLLQGRVRPGEPYPVVVEATGVAHDRHVAARSFATRYAAPAGGATVLAATPLGGGYRLELERDEAGEGGWSRLDVELPEPVALGQRELLVGLLGSGARALADRLGLRAGLIELEPAGLRALAVAGEALDVVVVGAGAAADPGQAAYLRAWVAGGGVLALDAPADRARVSPGLGVPWDLPDAGARVEALGAGFVIGPRSETAWSARPAWRPQPGLAAAWRLRLRERARRRALEGVLLEAPAPRPSPARGRRLAWAALAVAVALSLLTRLATRADPGTVTGAGVSLGLGLALALRLALAPSTPVVVETARVLEVPLGGRVARRLELLRAAAPRRAEAQLALPGRHGAGPPRPVFVSQVSAVRAGALLVDDPAGPRLEFPVGSTPRAFVRHDATPLAATFTVDAAQAAGLELLEAVRVDHEGVHLPDGATEPLDRWRVGGADPEARRWRRLAAAGLTGFDLRRGSVWLAKLAPTGAGVAAGVAEERHPPELLIAPTPF